MVGIKSVNVGQLSEESAKGWATSIKVQNVVGDADYPASKKALVEHAEQKGADNEVLSFLQRLPDQNYETPTAVDQEIS